MRFMFGIVIRLVVIVSFLIFVGWILGGLYLDRVIKTGIETVGPKITGTTVSLDRVNISVPTGNGRVRGLVVGNPKGFHTDSAFRLPDSKITFDPTSVLSGKLIIEQVVIHNPEITYEVNFSGNNLEKIQHNVEAFARKHGLNDGGPVRSRQKGSRAKLVQINHFIVKGPKLNVSASIFRGRSLTFELEEIHLRDIGKASGGVTVVNATSQVLSGTNERISQTVSRPHKLLGKRLKKADKGVKSVSATAEKRASEAFKAVRTFFWKIGEWIKSLIDWARKGVKGSERDLTAQLHRTMVPPNHSFVRGNLNSTPSARPLVGKLFHAG